MQKLHAFTNLPRDSRCNVTCKLAFTFTGRAYCIHVHVCTCVFQGEELLSACSAGSTTDVSALLDKVADVHFIGKVKRVNTLYTLYRDIVITGDSKVVFLSTEWFYCSSPGSLLLVSGLV